MKIKRRSFLQTSIASTTLFLSGFSLPVLASTTPKKNLIIISLRGALDGLSAVPVIGDKNLKQKRPDISMKNNLRLTGDFALHPSLYELHDLWKDDKASFVHATSIPYTGRSHFDGQNLMESGGHVPYQEKTGWLGRGMKTANLIGQGLALGLPMPLLLRGAERNDNYFPAKDKMPDPDLLKNLSYLYEDRSEYNLKATIDIIRKREITEEHIRRQRSPAVLATKAANLMSQPDGPRVAVFEVGGFDTHSAQAGSDGSLADSLTKVNEIIRALRIGLGEEFKNTLILTLTEFGRKVEQNNGFGTDHGYGSAILMAGGLLKKSQVYTDWPGLENKNLFENRDLLSTIDARAVYASAMSAVFNIEFKQINQKVFKGETLTNLTDKLFTS